VYTLGVLVQANYGIRDTLRIAGVPVGQHIRNDRIYSEADPAAGDTGSIIVVVATDAPLLPHQLRRIARRPALGLGRMGSYAGNGSGDIFVAFSTANAAALQGAPLAESASLGNDALDGFFNATAQATEEAIVNAMVAARDMQGSEGHYAKALPHAQLLEVLERYGRLVKPAAPR
jgi:D-aminopeptidase